MVIMAWLLTEISMRQLLSDFLVHFFFHPLFKFVIIKFVVHLIILVRVRVFFHQQLACLGCFVRQNDVVSVFSKTMSNISMNSNRTLSHLRLWVLIIFIQLLFNGILPHVANGFDRSVLRVHFRVSTSLLPEIFKVCDLNVAFVNVLGLSLFVA